MKDYPIGAIINDCHRRYKVTPSATCRPCAFWVDYEGECTCNHSVFGHCSETIRKDDTAVIFVDMGEEPTPPESALNQHQISPKSAPNKP